MSNVAKFTAGPWHTAQGMSQMVSMDTTVAEVPTTDGTYWWIFSPAKVHGDPAADAALIAAAPDLLSVAQAQHRALDILMARLIGLDPTFRPTQWEGWQAVVDGSAAIARATTPA